MKTLIFANFQILQTVEYLIEILIFVVIYNEAKFTIIPKRHNQQTLIFGNFQILKTVKYGSFDICLMLILKSGSVLYLGQKVKLSFVAWKMRHFKGPF